MTKAELRTSYIKKRQGLSAAEVSQKSRALCDRFFASIDLSFVGTLHIYLPIERFNEPDTLLIVDRLRREYPHIRIALPRVLAESGIIESYFFDGLHQLRENGWGIREPDSGLKVNPAEIDMVIVPLLVFDESGYRIGYGKGYYDKFLAQCRADCRKIGLAFFGPRERIPREGHDVPLNIAVTPEETISF